MNVSLPSTWEEFVTGQVASGEYGNASEVVREALRLLRERQESRALEEMRAAFAGVDTQGGPGEPTNADRALVSRLIKRRRQPKARP